MANRNLTTPRSTVFGDVDPGTTCRICGRDVTEDLRSKTCSDYCQAILEAVMSLLNWSSVRRRIVDRDDQTCQECGFDRRWVSKGDAHTRQIIQSKLPERPKGPSMLDQEAVDAFDWDDHLRELEDWREQRRELRERYGDPHEVYPDYRLEVDHRQRVADGGHPFDPSNLRTLCAACHKRKTAQENRRPARPQSNQERPEPDIQEFIEHAVR